MVKVLFPLDLYSSSKTSVRFPYLLSDEFNIRYGRVFLPFLLFCLIIFINDGLDNCDKYGVSHRVKNYCGDLFADDILF